MTATEHYFPTRPTPLAQLPGAVPLDGPADPQRTVEPDELVTMDRTSADPALTAGRIEQASWRVSASESAFDEVVERLRGQRGQFTSLTGRIDPATVASRGYRHPTASERAGLHTNRTRTAETIVRDCRLLATETANLRRCSEQWHRAEGKTDHPAVEAQRRRQDRAVADALDTLHRVAGEVPHQVPTAPVADALTALAPKRQPVPSPQPAAVQKPQTPPTVTPAETPTAAAEPETVPVDPQAALLAQLDELGVPPEASRAAHRQRLTEAGARVGDHRLAEAIRARRQRASDAEQPVPVH